MYNPAPKDAMSKMMEKKNSKGGRRGESSDVTGGDSNTKGGLSRQ